MASIAASSAVAAGQQRKRVEIALERQRLGKNRIGPDGIDRRVEAERRDAGLRGADQRVRRTPAESR